MSKLRYLPARQGNCPFSKHTPLERTRLRLCLLLLAARLLNEGWARVKSVQALFQFQNLFFSFPNPRNYTTTQPLTVLDTNPQLIIHFGTIRTHPRLFFSLLHTLPPNKPWPLEHSQPVPTAPRSNGLRSAVQLYPLFTVSLATHTLTRCQGIHSMEHANQRFDELPHNPANPAQSQSGYLTSYMTLLPQYLR